MIEEQERTDWPSKSRQSPKTGTRFKKAGKKNIVKKAKKITVKEDRLTSKLGLTFIIVCRGNSIMTQVEIITVSKKGQVVLPKKVREEMRVNQGSKLLLIEKEGKAVLSKLDPLLKDKSFTLLASEKSLAKDWLSKKEEEAWKDL